MSIQSEITRISTNVTDTLNTIADTGVEVASDANSDDLPTLAATLANTKQNVLTGSEGQFVGFNAEGTAEAQYPSGIQWYTADSEDGVTYTVTIPWIDALAAGQTFIIIPSMTSTTTNTKLNVNDLGAKYLRRPLTTNNAASTVGYSEGWIIANKPVLVMYDGTYYKTVSIQAPDANTIYGTVAIKSGGTGAVTAETARANLGAMPAKTSAVTVTASTTLALTHAETTVLVNSSAAITITIPLNSNVAFPVGTMINLCGIGTGTVTVAATSGVTLNSREGAVSIDGQYGAVTLYKAETNTWYMWGALA